MPMRCLTPHQPKEHEQLRCRPETDRSAQETWNFWQNAREIATDKDRQADTFAAGPTQMGDQRS